MMLRALAIFLFAVGTPEAIHNVVNADSYGTSTNVVGAVSPAPELDVYPGYNQGVAALPKLLTINEITKVPTFIYKLGDCDGTDCDPWGAYGDTCTAAGSGGAYNTGSPFMSSADDSVNPQGSRYWVCGTSIGNPGTDDFVIEFVAALDGTSGRLFAKFATTSDRIELDVAGGTQFQLIVNSISAAAAAAGIPGAIYHGLIFYDASNKAKMYLQGQATGGEADVSSVGSISNAAALTLAARTGGSLIYDDRLMYLAMWQGADWLDTHLQAAVAAERFAQALRTYPRTARGTAMPTQAARDSVATVRKETGEVSQLFTVGPDWMRSVRYTDKNGVLITGYLSESATHSGGQMTNKLVYTDEFSSGWTLSNAALGGTASKMGVEFTGLVANGVNTSHFIYQAKTLTTDTWTYSAYCTAGTDGTYGKDWAVLQSGDPDIFQFYSLGTCATGSNTGGGSTIELFADGHGDDACRMAFSFTGVASSSIFRIYPADADGDTQFIGDSTNASIYCFGAQLERGEYPSSYISSGSASGVREADELTYKGDDGNIPNTGTGSVVCSVLLPDYDHVDAVDPRLFTLSDGGATADRMSVFLEAAGDAVAVFVAAGGATQASFTGTTDIADGAVHEVGLTWTDVGSGLIELWVDGVIEGTDTSATIPDDIDQASIGQGVDALVNIYMLNGVAARCEFYDRFRGGL